MIAKEEKLQFHSPVTVSIPILQCTKITLEKDTVIIRYYFYDSKKYQTNRKVAAGSTKPISKIINLNKFK